jgi:wyosine [tRNA(Phe)-imidazoG37] synthetase (radical SAM superfamily)
MKSVYGPVRSWRLGVAMGIDPICRQPKVCNFKCIYCRLGHGGIMVTERGKFVDERTVMEEARDLLKEHKIDAVEFRGTGEPFLAKNLANIALGLRDLTDAPLCVVTNGSLFVRPDVQGELDSFDIIVVKLDCADRDAFVGVNRPHCSVTYDKLVEYMVRARRSHKGSFRVQVTVVRQNISDMERIVAICDQVDPEMVYLNTPGRSGTYEISKKELGEIAELFAAYKVRTVFDDLV